MVDGSINPANKIHMSAYIQNCIPEIEQAVFGRDVRRPIHDVILNLCQLHTSKVSPWINDIGLTVQDGKLCVVYQG